MRRLLFPSIRRWRLLSLLGMLIVVAVVFGWAYYHANWIKQRQEFLAWHTILFEQARDDPAIRSIRDLGNGTICSIVLHEPQSRELPRSLRVFGEAGVTHVTLQYVFESSEARDEQKKDVFAPELEHAKKLYPEARILAQEHYRTSP